MGKRWPNWEVLVVEKVDTIRKEVTVRLHSDDGQRNRFKEQTTGMFEHTVWETINLEVDLSVAGDPNKSVEDSTKLAGYAAVSKYDKYKDWTDILESSTIGDTITFGSTSVDLRDSEDDAVSTMVEVNTRVSCSIEGRFNVEGNILGVTYTDTNTIFEFDAINTGKNVVAIKGDGVIKYLLVEVNEAPPAPPAPSEG